MLNLRPYLARPLSTFASIAVDPLEAWIRFREQWAASKEGLAPSDLYTAEQCWEEHLCAKIAPARSAEVLAEFWALWPTVIRDMEVKGIQAGPATFKGWNDGDTGLVRAIWCLIRHLSPERVVETGVAHGVTSRIVLEALEKNGSGHLWSIDRPPIEPEWKAHIGLAVDTNLRHRWTYIAGSSRRRLPRLLSQLGEIDLFIHDSLHSERNVRFEMDRAWSVLRPSGAIVVDDIDVNRGFHSFTNEYPGHASMVCEAEPLRPDLRRFNKRGLFGVVLADPKCRN